MRIKPIIPTLNKMSVIPLNSHIIIPVESSDLQSSQNKHASQPNLVPQLQLKLPDQTDGEANNEKIKKRVGDFDADDEVREDQTMA